MNKWIIFTLMMGITLNLSAITGEEIIEKSDNLQSFSTVQASGKMVSTDRFGTIESTFRSWSRGDNEFLLEFTNIEEAGQKVLRVDGDIYLYDPDAEDTLRMSGSALKDSLFGDISYEDVSEGNDTLDRYNAELEGEDTLDGVPCYRVRLTAKSRSVPYAEQVVWIGKEDFVLRKGEYYSRRGTFLKELRVLEVTEVEGKVILSHMILEDKIRGNSSTELIMKDIQVNIPLDDRKFTEEALF